MRTLDDGQDKMQKICDELRKSILEPAKKEALQIEQEAKNRAEEIIRQAKKEAADLIKSARKEIEQEQNVFQSSLSQGIKQGLEALRQDIEDKLFNEQLEEVVKKSSQNKEAIIKLIDCIVRAIEKEGLSADISAIVPKEISEREINSLLVKEILEKLKDHSVSVGSFDGGVQVKLNDKNLTIDVTDHAIKELLASYIRKDFRKLVFASGS
ncbi:MAG TPA: V-type ATP synthase subunit E [Parachlamydiaceae bacterium]|nr:V-type ATP synthase subunit E [Parachlamydiaceae bacterium]